MAIQAGGKKIVFSGKTATATDSSGKTQSFTKSSKSGGYSAVAPTAPTKDTKISVVSDAPEDTGKTFKGITIQTPQEYAQTSSGQAMQQAQTKNIVEKIYEDPNRRDLTNKSLRSQGFTSEQIAEIGRIQDRQRRQKLFEEEQAKKNLSFKQYEDFKKKKGIVSDREIEQEANRIKLKTEIKKIDNDKKLNIIQKEEKKRELFGKTAGTPKKQGLFQEVESKQDIIQIKSIFTTKEQNLLNKAIRKESMTPQELKELNQLSIDKNKQISKLQAKKIINIPKDVLSGAYEVGYEIGTITGKAIKSAYNYGYNRSKQAQDEKSFVIKYFAKDLSRVLTTPVKSAFKYGYNTSRVANENKQSVLTYFKKDAKASAILIGAFASATGQQLGRDLQTNSTKTLTKAIIYFFPETILSRGKLGLQQIKATTQFQKAKEISLATTKELKLKAITIAKQTQFSTKIISNWSKAELTSFLSKFSRFETRKIKGKNVLVEKVTGKPLSKSELEKAKKIFNKKGIKPEVKPENTKQEIKGLLPYSAQKQTFKDLSIEQYLKSYINNLKTEKQVFRDLKIQKLIELNLKKPQNLILIKKMLKKQLNLNVSIKPIGSKGKVSKKKFKENKKVKEEYKDEFRLTTFQLKQNKIEIKELQKSKVKNNELQTNSKKVLNEYKENRNIVKNANKNINILKSNIELLQKQIKNRDLSLTEKQKIGKQIATNKFKLKSENRKINNISNRQSFLKTQLDKKQLKKLGIKKEDIKTKPLLLEYKPKQNINEIRKELKLNLSKEQINKILSSPKSKSDKFKKVKELEKDLQNLKINLEKLKLSAPYPKFKGENKISRKRGRFYAKEISIMNKRITETINNLKKVKSNINKQKEIKGEIKIVKRQNKEGKYIITSQKVLETKQGIKGTKTIIKKGEEKSFTINIGGEKELEFIFEGFGLRTKNLSGGVIPKSVNSFKVNLKNISVNKNSINKQYNSYLNKPQNKKRILKELRFNKQFRKEQENAKEYARRLQSNKKLSSKAKQDLRKKLDTKLSNMQKIASKTIQLSFIKQIPRLNQTSKQTSKLVNKQVLKQVNRQVNKQVNKNIPKQIPRLTIKDKIKPVKQVLTPRKPSPRNKPTPPRKPPIIPRKPPLKPIPTKSPPPPIPKPKLKPTENKKPLFTKKGLFQYKDTKTKKKVIIKTNLPINKARKLALKGIDNSIQAKVKVIGYSRTKAKDIKPINNLKFRLSKKNKETLIEKNRFRLDTLGEKKQISFAKAIKPSLKSNIKKKTTSKRVSRVSKPLRSKKVVYKPVKRVITKRSKKR